MIPKNLKSGRKQIDATKVKKHSDIMRHRGGSSLVVAGAREETPRGYRVPGFSGKSFETFYEVMLPRTSTPVLRHPKKDRVIRVASGSAYVVHDNEQHRLIAGDELALERGTSYRIATSGEQADLFVCQQAKYEVSLEVVEDVGVGVGSNVPEDLLEEPTLDERLGTMRPAELDRSREGSKAKEQLKDLHEDRRALKKAAKDVSEDMFPEFAPAVTGINARPTGGRFGEEGAG